MTPTDIQNEIERAKGCTLDPVEALSIAAESLAVRAVQEAMSKPVARVIDLRKRYDISTTELPSGFFESIERITFDPDPEARLHCKGVGRTPNESVSDLLDQLADAAVAQADDLPPVGPDHVRPLMSCSPFEPPEFGESVAECRSDDDE